MVSGPAPDLAALSAPTREQPPTGRSVRYEGDHDRIRAARRADGAHRPRGVWQRELKRADWNAVIEEAAATLTQRSKDLQVAAWLVEALVERDGFAALAPGLDFLEALLERYWDGLFPALDEDGDPEARLAPLFWLDGRLAVVARQQPLTTPEHEPGALSYTDYANARRLERIRIHDAAAAATSEERGAVTLAAFEEAIGRTPQPALRTLAGELEAAEAALARLVATADRLAGAQAPSMHELAEALGEVRALVKAALRPAPTSPEPPPNRRAPRAARPPPVAVDETLRDRAAARDRLADVAAYLRAYEPHAPMRFLVERALDWWDRPLDEILEELAAHGDAGAVLHALSRGDRESDERDA